jgi:hypothetical protein
MLPVHLAKDVDVIIAIDVSRIDYNINENSSVINILTQSIANLQQRIIEQNLETVPADVDIILIRPDVSKFGLMEFKTSKHQAMIRIGEEEAKKVLNTPRAKRILGM